jgi:hypothetical protein
MFMLTGGGLVWVGRADRKDRAPNTIPEAFMVDNPADGLKTRVDT